MPNARPRSPLSAGGASAPCLLIVKDWASAAQQATVPVSARSWALPAILLPRVLAGDNGQKAATPARGTGLCALEGKSAARRSDPLRRAGAT
jgi:hypothetical protein